MTIESLTPENWKDVLNAVQKQLKTVAAAKLATKEEKSEQARLVNSLKESADGIERIIDELRLFKDDLPFGNKTHLK